LRAAEVVDCREFERDASFFTLLVVGLLMRNAPRFKDDRSSNRQRNIGAA
jgi:hypothetical protein